MIRRPSSLRVLFAHLGALCVLLVGATSASAQPARFLGREEIVLYGIGLRVEPATQTVPKDFATIVSTFLQAPTLPGDVPPFAPDAEMRATLRGPSFAQPIELTAQPNSPFNIPVLTVPGTHVLENIRMVSGGEVVMRATPESARIDVIERLLVTTVTARPLTADEIREKGIVFDRDNFQAYNFTAAFAVDDGSKIDIAFPVVLPTITGPKSTDVTTVDLEGISGPMLKGLKTIIPDTLQIQARIPNLSVVGFTLTLDQQPSGQQFVVPPIPGVIVIPGDIGFLNQYFSVMLMVANVAPTGSKLVVSELTANIVLPPGIDNVVGSQDDPLRMANLATGESARLVPVTQAGADGKLGTGDDITTLGPGETGNAEFLVEGRREGTHVVEMELAGTLNGLPIGPVPIRGRAAGAVLVRNPKFTLTFTHPDIVNAGEPYTLDVTVTNTSESPANFVSVNLFSQNISGARLDDDGTKGIDSIAPGDSASVSFNLISNLTGTITAATLDSDENVAGRFQLKTAVGELGVPLSPDSLILPKEASGLPKDLRDAALGLLGRAWAVATAPPAALPKDLSRFSKQLVIDRAVETAEAGFRVQLGEPLPRAVETLFFDFLGSDYTELASRVPANDTTGLLGLLQRDFKGFDLLRRRSIRGDVLTSVMAKVIAPSVAAGAAAFHRDFAEQATSRPAHVSVLVSGANGGTLDFDASLVDANGLRLGPVESGKVVSEIPFGDVMTFTNAQGDTTARLFVIAVPEPGRYTLALSPLANAPPDAKYDVSVVVPGADGKLRVTSLSNLGATDGFDVTNGATGAQLFRVAHEATGGTSNAPTLSMVTDPAPTVLGVVQMASADVVGCSAETDPGKQYNGGRVIAVLFSEEVTAESVQDKLSAGEIVAFKPEANRAISVALQPGRRIAFVALRKPFGPLVPRTMTIEGAVDRSGQPMAAAVTLPIQMSNLGAAATVSGRVLRADGTPAAGVSLRMFYEIQCADGPIVVGIGEDTAGDDGSYAFDHVVVAPPVQVKLVAVDEDAGEVRVVRFRPARVGQRLNVDVVFIGRGTITGITYAEDGRTPLVGTAVRVTSLTDQSQYGATTDAEGRYTIARVPVGSLLLEAVNVARPATLFVSDVIPFAGAVVTRDLSMLDVDTTVRDIKTGTITGRVLRADGVTGVEGVPVIAYYKHGSQAGVGCPAPPNSPPPSECAVAVVQSGANGAFSFPAVTSGALRIYSFDQTGLEEGSVRVTLLTDQTFDLNLLLSGGVGTVRGTVLDSNGAPVTDAVVGGGLSLVNVNPADGTFVLTDVPVGQRTLVAVSESLRARGETTIDLVQSGEQINATIVLEPSASIAGVVRNADGVAQAGIKVWVFVDCYDEHEQPSVCIEGQAVTDATGGYRVDGLKLRTYRVSAFRGDLKDGNIAQVALRYNAQVLKTDITFRGALGKVTGRVLRACGAPPCADTPLPAKVAISGERLVLAGGMIATEFRYIQNFKVVDNDFTTGEFEFDGIWSGDFTVKAAGQFSPEPVSAAGTMTPGQTVNIDLRLQPTSRITGTLYEPDGFTPVTNRQVALEFKSNAVVVICTEDSSTGDTECQSIPQGIQSYPAATDAQGHFSFPIVNAGPFTITATDAVQGRTARVEGTVRAGETVDVTARLLGRSRVVVNVKSNNGTTPIPSAHVELTQVDYPKATREGVTNALGQVIFEGGDALSEGLFVVSATDGGGFVGRASSTVTTDGATVTVNVFLFDATGTVTGQVVRQDGTSALVPVPNAEVLVHASQGPIAYTITNASGQFEVPLVPTGPITAEAFDPVTAGRGRVTATVFNGLPTTFTVRLEALGVIRGTLSQSGTLTPLKGWTVELHQTTPSGRGLPTQLAQTGVDGSFTFPGASVGSFLLRARHKDFVSSTTTATGSLDRGGQLVDVPLVAEIVRRVTGTITGLVTGPTGTPIGNAQVDVCPTGESCRPTTAGADGRFSQADIPLGRFYVRASAQVTGAPSVGTTGGTLLFEGDTADVTITLLGLSVIEGTVYELVGSTRVPAANASVSLSGHPDSGCTGACTQGTAPDGTFRFINVPARTFTITATGLSGQRGSVGDALNSGETKTGLEILLSPTVSLSGRVLLSTGEPAQGIVAEFARGNARLFAETGADGRFSFAAISAGTYSLLFQDPVGIGLARRSGTIAVAGPIDLGDITLDDVAPMVTSSTPGAGDVGVSMTTEIRVTFNEPVTTTTINDDTITLVGPSGPITGLVDLIENDTVARFRLLPGSTLTDKTAYSLRVTGVKDRVGRPMTADYTATFTTVDITPPTIIETTPVSDASGATIHTTVRVRFSEILDTSRFSGPAIIVRDPSNALIDGRIDYLFGNTTVVFSPARPLAEDTRYTVTVARATDLTGLSQPSATQFAFSTTDRTPPVVTQLVPAGNGSVIENAITTVAATVAPTDVAFVDFYINDTFAFTDRLTPFAMTLQASPQFGAPGAQIKVSALATDTSGNRSTTPAVAFVSVIADQPPTIGISQPAATIDATPGQRIDVRVDAGDDLGVTQIAYSARGAIVIDAATRTLTTPALTRSETFAFNVPLNALPGSTITIDASTLDTKGQSRGATPVLVRVLDSIGPTVEITGVTSGENVQPGQTVTAIVSASDPGKVAAIGFAASGVVSLPANERTVNPAQSSVATSFTFTVPATATSTDRVFLDAYARDVAGNRTDAARLILPVADRVPPTVSVRTQLGTLDMVPGQPVGLIVEAHDDRGVSRVVLSTTGAFTFNDSRSFSPPLGDASASMSINVPSTVATGATLVVTVRAIDVSGNQSTPVSITLTARAATDVTMPPSITLLAGDVTSLAVTLGAPAPAGGVTLHLSSSAPAVATVTSTLVFAEGDTTKPATVTAVSGGTAQINAAIDGTTRATTTVSVRGGVIRGTVVTASAAPGQFTPVAGAQVTVFHDTTPLTATTDGDGTYVVEGVDGRDFAIRATDGTLLGYTEGTLDVLNGSASVTTILLPAGSLHGTVLTADGAAAGADVKVDLYEASAPSVIIATTFTAADGTWQFPIVAIREYILMASDVTGNQGRSNASVTQSGLDVEVPITFLGRATVTVTVLSGAGTPVPNATVELRSSSIFGSAPQRTTSTNASGVASFANVFVGSFTVTANDPQTQQGGSTTGLILAHGTPVPVTVTLASYGNLRGTVYRANGTTRAAGVSVNVRCASNACNTTTTTDSEGNYAFTFLKFTSFTVKATDGGTRAIGQSSGAFTTSGETLVRDIVFEPQGALLVTVNDADGQPVVGASVTAQSTNGVLTDTLSGVTGTVNGVNGQLLLDHLLAGNATVSASAAGLGGSAVAIVSADTVTPVTIQLEPRASITVNVLDQDGQTPAAGTALLIGTGGSTLASSALVNGAATFADRKFGTYALIINDTGGRRRASINGIVLDVNGEIETRDLTFVALGTVKGRVLHQTNVGNLTVTLRSFNTEFGGYFYDQTDAAGNYEIGGVPLGLVVVSAQKPAESLVGETTGTLTSYLLPLTLDILLENNAVTLPTTLTDANSTYYVVAQGGGFGNGTGGVFSRGAMALDITANGTTTRFAGPALGTREDASREIATRDIVAGLNVTRKVFVPTNGYFARFVESFSNPTTDPITIDVSIASKLYGGRDTFCCVFGERDHYVGSTSSGDSVLGTDDRWAALGASGSNPYQNGNEGASLGFVFDGEGGADTIDAVTYTPAASDNPFTYGWNSITIPAGGTVSLMHFVSAQGGITAARASAERLVQLPPEALEGLSEAELLTIRNFAVPAGGVSTVAPLPALTGTVTGRVLEGNGTTPIANAPVVVRSSVGVFPRQLSTATNANGEYTMTGGVGLPLPVADFTVQAQYPLGGLFIFSNTHTVSFPEGATAVSKDIVFPNHGILTGTVRRHTGVAVSGARVTTESGRLVTTDTNGRYFMGGVPAGTYTLSGTVLHPQGTALSIGALPVTVAAGEVRDDNLVVEPTGAVTGVLKNAAGALQVGQGVYLEATGYQRYTQTDSSGRFAFPDVRLGTFTLRSNDPLSGYPARLTVTVVQDATTDVELRYLGSGTITVTVLRANGTPASSIDVSVSGSGFSRPTQRTTATGVLTFTDIPINQVATITARHSGNSNIAATATATVTPESGGTITQGLSMPGYGVIRAQVSRPNGSLAGAGVSVSITGNTGSFSGTTDVNSQVTLGPVLLDRTFTLRASNPLVTINFSRPFLETQHTGLVADDEVKAVSTHYPAVARLAITVQTPNGTPVVGAKVETQDKLFTGFQNRGNTNASGVVEVAQVPEGDVTIRVYDPANATKVIEVATVAIPASADNGTVNTTVTYRNFTVSVRARFFQADGVTPLPLPIAIELLRGGDRVLLARGCATTNSCFFGAVQGTNGEVVFTNVTSTGAGLIVRSYAVVGGSSIGTYETPVVPTADGEVVVTTVQPFLRAALRGRVFANDGTTPVTAGAVFAQTLAGASYSIGGVGVGDDGTFNFSSFLTYLPTEGLKLRLSVPGIPNFDTPTGPVTTLDQVVSTDIVLPPSLFTTIRGRVVAADGVTPVPASMLATYQGGTTGFGSSAENGRFETRIALPVDGAFTLRATSQRNSAVFVERSDTATTQGGIIDVGDMILPVSVVSGRLTYGTATPVPFPNVFAYDAATFTSYYTDRTDADGNFWFIGLPAAAYTVTGNDDNGNEVSAPVTLDTDTSVVNGVSLQLPEQAELNVHVLDRAGVPAAYANAVVRIGADFERRLGWFENTTEGGEFTLTVPLGDVVVEAEVLHCADPDWWDTCAVDRARAAETLDTPNATYDLVASVAENGSVAYNGVAYIPDGGGSPQSVTGSIEVSYLGQATAGLSSPQRTEVLNRVAGQWQQLNLPWGPLRLMMRSGNFMEVFDLDGPDPNSGYGVGPFLLFPAQRVRFVLIQPDDSFYADTPLLVTIDYDGAQRRLTATTDENGELVIDGLGRGGIPNNVTFYLLDGSQIAIPVEVWATGDTEQFVEVRLIQM